MIETINKALSLKDVNEQFERFRVSRKKMTKFPDQLWKQAVSLLKNHSISEVARVLRVSSAQIKTQLNNLKPDIPSGIDFISVPQSETALNQSFPDKFKQDAAQIAKVEIFRPDGTQLVISNLSESTLPKLLSCFIGGL